MKKLAIIAAVAGVTFAAPAVAQHNGGIVSLDNTLERYDTATRNSEVYGTLSSIYGNRNWYGYNADSANRYQSLSDQANDNAISLLNDTINVGTGTRQYGVAREINRQNSLNAYQRLRSAGEIDATGAKPYLDAYWAHQDGWTGDGTRITYHNNRAVNTDILTAIAPGAQHVDVIGFSGTRTTYSPGTVVNVAHQATRADGTISYIDSNNSIDIVLNGSANATDLDDHVILVGNYGNSVGGLHGGYTGADNVGKNISIVAGATSLVMDKFEGTSAGVITDIMYGTADSSGKINIARALSPHGVLR